MEGNQGPLLGPSRHKSRQVGQQQHCNEANHVPRCFTRGCVGGEGGEGQSSLISRDEENGRVCIARW